MYDVAPMMREGDEIIFGSSGCLKAMVTEVSRTSFVVDFTSSGTIESCAVIKLPAPRVSQMPVLTLSDKLDIKEFAARHNFDYIVVPSV